MSNNLMSNMLTEHVMEKVARDKIIMQQRAQQKQEKQAAEEAAIRAAQNEFDPDFDDEELKSIMSRLKEERLQEMDLVQKKLKKQSLGQGEYREIVEEEFLPSVTKNPLSIVHFYHNDFQRCKIVDKHLKEIAQKHPECKFFYMNAEKSPFFVQKLSIQMLPTITIFIDGILKDRIVGFSDFGGTDDFRTIQLARRLVHAKVIKARTKAEKGFNLKVREDNSESDEEASDLEQQE